MNLKRSLTLIVTLLTLIAILTGCSQKVTTKETLFTTEQPESITFTDSLDTTVNVTSFTKIAVLSGSLAHAWELAGGTLTAVTDDYWELENPSTEAIVSLGSLSDPSIEQMVNSDIDFAILSANISDQVALKSNLKSAGITTAYFDVNSFEDYSYMMKIFTNLTGRSDLFEQNVTFVQEEIETQLNRVTGDAPTILLLRSYSSGIKAKGSNSMTGQMLKDLGCTNIADNDSAFIDNLSMEAIIMADPDFIFITIMGDEDAALTTIEQTFAKNSSWSSLTAVKNNHYVILPKDLFQNKPNERWGKSYKILANILYGE